MNSATLIITILVAALIALAVCLRALARRISDLRDKYAPISDVEVATREAERKRQELITEIKRMDEQDLQNRARLNAEYANAKAIYDSLKRDIALLEEDMENISYGIYKPHFDYDTPEECKIRIELLRDIQKQTIREGKATFCPIQWRVEGRRAEGERMVKQFSKLDSLVKTPHYPAGDY